MSASSPLDRVRENLRRDETPWDSLIDNHRICRVWKDDLALLVALADACCECEPSHDNHGCGVQEALYALVTETST